MTKKRFTKITEIERREGIKTDQYRSASQKEHPSGKAMRFDEDGEREYTEQRREFRIGQPHKARKN